jgi:hypothetical protein
MWRFITLPLTSKGVYKDNYLQFNSSKARVYSSLLIKFDNTSKKGKIIKKVFS